MPNPGPETSSLAVVAPKRSSADDPRSRPQVLPADRRAAECGPVQWSIATTAADRRDVCSLRHRAYAAVGKVAPDRDPATLWEPLDAVALVLVARRAGAAVASARLALPAAAGDFEIARQIELPKHLPPAETMVEVSRFCVDPEAWGSELFPELVSHCLEHALRHGRRFVIASATGVLCRAYRQLGAQPLGVRYAFFGSHVHEVLLWNLAKVMAGVGSTPAKFDAIVRPALQRLGA